jgi:hypothetical protein
MPGLGHVCLPTYSSLYSTLLYSTLLPPTFTLPTLSTKLLPPSSKVPTPNHSCGEKWCTQTRRWSKTFSCVLLGMIAPLPPCLLYSTLLYSTLLYSTLLNCTPPPPPSKLPTPSSKQLLPSFKMPIPNHSGGEKWCTQTRRCSEKLYCEVRSTVAAPPPPVVVLDTTPPVLKLNGNGTVAINKQGAVSMIDKVLFKSTWTDPFAIAIDDKDGDVSAGITAFGGSAVDTSRVTPPDLLFSYKIEYTAR